MKNVYVIIVTYNGKQWYDRCFESLRLSSIPIKTIVIDNASKDDTVCYIKSHYPEVYLIESGLNLGFGQANNIGIKFALQNNVDYVFLLNQDAWIEPDSIRKLIEIHKKNNSFGVLSPIHLNVEKNEIEKGLLEYITDYKLTNTELINDMYFNTMAELYEVKYVNAAAWLLPRMTLDRIGGFDPIFFHYGEDDNYMHRIIFHGYKIGICPKIRIVHDTKRRITISEKAQQSYYKTLLVECTNINLSLNLSNRILFLLRKAILKLFSFKFKMFKHYFSLLVFLLTMKKDILNSRNQNVMNDSSWL